MLITKKFTEAYYKLYCTIVHHLNVFEVLRQDRPIMSCVTIHIVKNLFSQGHDTF